MQFSIQTADPLAPRATPRLPEECVLRICKELAYSPTALMQWLEETQPHIRWATGEHPVEGLPFHARQQIHALFIDTGYMSYSDSPEYSRDEHTHLLTPQFSIERIDE